MSSSLRWALGGILCAVCLSAPSAVAGPVFSTPTPSGLILTSLGSVASIDSAYPSQVDYYQSLMFDGNNTLLMAVDDPNASTETIWQMSVERAGDGQIVSLGPATVYATVQTTPDAQGASFNGGLAFAPNGSLLYTVQQYGTSANPLGQYSGTWDLSVTANIDPTEGGLGGLAYLPAGGTFLTSLPTPTSDYYDFKVSTAGGTWHDIAVAAGTTGVYTSMTLYNPGIDVPAITFTYIPASDGKAAAVLIETPEDTLAMYAVDAFGNPTGSGTSWVLGNDWFLGDGLARDPVTGAILFTANQAGSSSVSNAIFEVGAPSPEPSTAVLFGGALAIGLAAGRRRLLHRDR